MAGVPALTSALVVALAPLISTERPRNIEPSGRCGVRSGVSNSITTNTPITTAALGEQPSMAHKE